MRVFLLILMPLLFSCSGNDSEGVATSRYSSVKEERLVQEYLDLVNHHRSTLGLSPFIQHNLMEDEARTHSFQMGRFEVPFGHQGMSLRCAKIKLELSPSNRCAENVARFQSSPEEVLRSWLSSSGHAANINNPRHTHTGVGLFINEDGQFYWTQIFLEVL